MREFILTTQDKYKGLRMYITKVNLEDSEGKYATGLGGFKLYGKEAEA